MSSDLDCGITHRLREEVSRLGLSFASAAAAIGDSNRMRMKNVLSGNQRCPSDVLARLAPMGVDVVYVLTGIRMPEIWRDQITRVLRTTAEVEPEGGRLTELALRGIAGLVAEPPAEYGELSADERQLLALFRRADLTDKMRAVAVLDGVRDPTLKENR